MLNYYKLNQYKLYKIYLNKTVFSYNIKFDERTLVVLLIKEEISNNLLDNIPLLFIFLLIIPFLSYTLPILLILPLGLTKQLKTLS